ncbi:MAG TPA: hypothetical protein PKY50_04805 [Candidatus Competibacter sp.]|nr:hypothetical protein [Candidatus Competibacter sp.]
MQERVVRIGQPTPLIGIITEPDTVVDEQTAMLLLNSGVMHRVGSCRLSVKVARAVAERVGLPTLRFDFSGIGDSEVRRGAMGFEKTAAAEVSEVMDYLQHTRGVSRFVLYGLCSGGHVACRVGQHDKRVRQIIQIDGYCFPTWKSWLYHYAPRLMSLDKWKNLIKRRKAGVMQQAGYEIAGIPSEYFEPADLGDTTPSQQEIMVWMAKLVDNDISLYCLFTGKEPGYNYLGQFRDCYSDVHFGNRLAEEYMSESSHIVSDPESQRRVVESIVNWLKTHYLFSC